VGCTNSSTIPAGSASYAHIFNIIIVFSDGRDPHALNTFRVLPGGITFVVEWCTVNGRTCGRKEGRKDGRMDGRKEGTRTAKGSAFIVVVATAGFI